MTIALECDVCGKKYKLNDSLAGKTFTCKECGLALDVPGGRRTRGEEVIDRPPPKSSATIRATGGKKRSKKTQSNPMPMLAVGGGVLVVVVILGVIFGGGSPKGPSLAPPVQNTVDTPQPVVPVVAAATTPASNTAPTPVQTQPVATSTTPTTPTPDKPPSPATSAAASKIDSSSNLVITTEASANWSAAVDPPAEPPPTEWATDWSASTAGGFLSDSSISYPITASPFAFFGNLLDSKSSLDVWNLATGKKEATLKGVRPSSSASPALSPDGKYLAWNDYRAITVYDLEAKKSLGELPAALGDARFLIGRIDLPTGNRLVAMSSVDRGFRAWSLPEGQLLHATPMGDKFSNLALSAYSPGGKFVALESHFLEHTIQIHEVDTGNLTGIINVKKSPGKYSLPHRMAFSPDGSQLGILFESTTGDGITHIELWNMADGTRSAQFLIEPGILHRVKNVRNATGLQWFADGRKLLVHGVAIVDAQSGKVQYELEAPDPDMPGSRRALGGGVIADVAGTRQELQLKPLVISDEDLQRSEQIAAAGGLPIDVKLPPLTKSELVTPGSAVASVDWRVTPQVPPTIPEVATDPLPFKSGKGTARQLQIALQDQPRAFVKFGDGEDANGDTRPSDIRSRVDSAGRIRTSIRTRPVKAKSNWVDVYDLATKQFVSKIELPFSGDLLSCSPDGRRILVHPHDSQGRLDVFDVADGQPVLAFRPYQSLEEERDWDLQSAVMLDGDHIATLNDNDLFAIWELPACRAICAVDKALSFEVSPGGNLIALVTETGIDLRDSRTGQSTGFVPLKGVIRSVAFHPQGDRLGVILGDGGGNYFTSISLNDGQIGNEIPIAVYSKRFIWINDRYALVPIDMNNAGTDFRLLDLQTGTAAWSYTLRGSFVVGNSPDMRLWYAVPKSPRVPAFQLVAAMLPDAPELKKLAAEDLTPEMLLKPGDKIALRVNVTAPPARPQLEQEVMNLAHKAIERSGLSVATSAPVELHITATAASGKSIPLQILATKETTSINELTLNIEWAYKRGSGTLRQGHFKASNASGFILKRVPEGESVQAAFDKDLWDRMTYYFNGLELPAQVFGQKSTSGVGTSSLGPGGPVTAK